jgi:hypothetical protein
VLGEGGLLAGDIFVRPVGERQDAADDTRFTALLGNELGEYRVRGGDPRGPSHTHTHTRTLTYIHMHPAKGPESESVRSEPN